MARHFTILSFLTPALLMAGIAAGAEENASNPLAAVNNTDIRYQ
ncbi:hypothetical protein [Ruegeria sp. AU67]|nr:hypothetical protein [Ruegeria sp. AU67]